MIQVGDRLPDMAFKAVTAGEPEDLGTAEIFAGRTVVLFAVPGAFTPTCSNNHLPGFLQHRDEILAKGVDAIAVTGVNDVFVMKAWARETGGLGRIQFLADGSGDFARSIGMELDASAFGLGLRSERYSMLVRDGVVESLSVEEGQGTERSGAQALLASLA